mmetsp:Transcript_88845/g.212100  ORF Transcript_88845/g.212100 Transcript_88845/m.212100 type:complete len:208 (+) Transcript_88845:276-899(+)
MVAALDRDHLVFAHGVTLHVLRATDKGCLVCSEVSAPLLAAHQVVHAQQAIFADHLELAPVGRRAAAVEDRRAVPREPQGASAGHNGVHLVEGDVRAHDLLWQNPAESPQDRGQGVPALVPQAPHGLPGLVRAPVAALQPRLVRRLEGKGGGDSQHLPERLAPELLLHLLGPRGVVPHGAIHPLQTFTGAGVDEIFEFFGGSSHGLL